MANYTPKCKLIVHIWTIMDEAWTLPARLSVSLHPFQSQWVRCRIHVRGGKYPFTDLSELTLFQSMFEMATTTRPFRVSTAI